MDYKKLSERLTAKRPTGWDVVKYIGGVSGGVYLWPESIPRIREQENPKSRISGYAILFEFHVTKAGNYARILARAHFNEKSAEQDVRWLAWRDIALTHCLAKEVKNSPSDVTKSLAKWDGSELGQIRFDTNESIAAKHIRAYLKEPPQSLTVFIGHLWSKFADSENKK